MLTKNIAQIGKSKEESVVLIRGAGLFLDINTLKVNKTDNGGTAILAKDFKASIKGQIEVFEKGRKVFFSGHGKVDGHPYRSVDIGAFSYEHMHYREGQGFFDDLKNNPYSIRQFIDALNNDGKSKKVLTDKDIEKIKKKIFKWSLRKKYVCSMRSSNGKVLLFQSIVQGLPIVVYNVEEARVYTQEELEKVEIPFGKNDVLKIKHIIKSFILSSWN